MSKSAETSQASGGSQWPASVDEREEKRLIRACQKGDHEAFERLVQAFENQVFGLAYNMLHDRDEAEDLAQEVFISAFRNIGKFRFEARMGTWLYRITVNLVKNRWKYHQRRERDKHDSLDEPRSEEDARPTELPDPRPDPRRQAESREMLAILEERLRELSPEFQEIVALRFGQGLAYEEIAAALECSIGTVKSRINRARRQLRENMQDVL